MFVPRLHVLMCLAGWLLIKVTIWDGLANHLFSTKHQPWIILGVSDLSVIWKGEFSSALEQSVSPWVYQETTSLAFQDRHKETNTAASEQHVTLAVRGPEHGGVLSERQRLCPSHYFWNNSGGGPINTALVGFVELMTSCFSGLWNRVTAKISKIGSWI